ncbi:ribonuclease R [Fonticella tunisiensis]|uniref:Ribonuclease R n=1 Tax=Fonticella tunisiensis TaxID=1096341 RepID=A0A4R7KC62_9CLOT|nr:ribonuclease R [Fonticella tunisiensis]TDT50752.1 RNAse R [Fonticella tunisiensis]
MSRIKEKLLDFMREEAYKPMTAEELALIFDINKKEWGMFYSILDEMELEGKVIKTRKNRYGIPERMNMVVGKLQGNPKGFGFVIPDIEGQPDVYIPAEGINGAMHNDRVIAKIVKEGIPGKKIEGEIIRILERANTKIVGTFEKSDYFGFVIPDDKRIYQDIFIPKADINGAKNGYKVVVEVVKWPEKRRNPEGKIIEILGSRDNPGIDILSIIKKYNLPEEFPEEVEKYAAKIPDEIDEREYERRRDLRNLKIVTIDGEDAKDLDDAVSVEKLPDGKYRLGVHIADVTYYVKEKSPLDKEAFKRATSVYLVDRVIPMLPKKLSNGLCSLNPRVDRLTLTCMMTIDSSGRVVDHEIFESIIKTCERMTYTEVTKILRDRDPELMERYSYLIEDFKIMEELCNILYNKRMQRGALDFEFEESKIVLDEKGKPVEIKPYEREIANRIIEEFMLVCNETVAEHMYWSGVPFVYRVHEDPDEEKLAVFGEFIHNLGYFMRPTREIHPKVLQEILEEVKGKREEAVVSTLLLRSLKQARYSPECTGHFGLSARYYCHFTSPIRRYPDLAIHRIIKEFIAGKIDEKREKKLRKFVEDASKQSSDMERVAQEAERETEDLKKVEFMSDKIGNVYTGIISSVTSFGMFVELENTIEGLVHISNMVDDFYIYDEKHYSLIGERMRKVYRLGDTVTVKVIKTDIENRTIDFALADEYEE